MQTTEDGILVTGSTGFVGSHLTESLLKQGFSVYGTSRSAQGDEKLRAMGCHPVRIDLENTPFPLKDGALPRVAAVFHVAGKLAGSLEELNAVNEAGTEKIAEYYARHNERARHDNRARHDKRQRFIYVSSVAAGGPSSESCPKKESAPPKPISHYGMSKLAGENVVRRYAADLSTTIIRPGIVFGPGDKEFLRLIKALYRVRLNPLIGTGRQPLAFIEVHDLVQLLIRCLKESEYVTPPNAGHDPSFPEDWTGIGVYNAADADPLSIYELGRIFREATGRFVLPLRMPAALAWGIGALGETTAKLTRMTSTLTRDKIREATASGWWVSPEKANQQLQWKPAMPIRETMRDWILDCMQKGLL